MPRLGRLLLDTRIPDREFYSPIQTSHSFGRSAQKCAFAGDFVGRVTEKSTVNLAHHDVERPNDGWDVGDQAAAAELVGDGQIAERAAPRPGAPGDRTAVTDHHEAHLAAGALGLQI